MEMGGSGWEQEWTFEGVADGSRHGRSLLPCNVEHFVAPLASSFHPICAFKSRHK